ncbi:9 [Durusdinium trenchii]|uniref:11-endoperoxide prostaglandin H2 reductase (Prostaglandin F2-alpha synthase) n=1 Tax=Durusdinium trenchii TaxID=1381693 RepID=A0ABP0HI36_9DINO
MGCCRSFCGILVLLLALLIGWLQVACPQPHPTGLIFATVFTIMGYNKPMTEPVPKNLEAAKKHEGERTLTLASGAKMPAIGIGMCCRPTAYHQESVYNTILWYLLQGGRHIDTAEIYGNHVAIGQALKEAAKRGVPREEVFLVTKVWPEDFGYDSTVHAVERMLQDLGVDYIDVVLMHAPRKLAPLLVWHMYMEGSVDEFYNHGCKNHVACRRNTWKAMSELKDQGKIRDLGVSNFQIDQMKELQALKLAPISVHQFQYHPWLPEFQQKVVEFCHANKIAITAYNSLGGFKDKDKALVIEGLKAVGKKHSRSTGQVLLRWALEKNVSVIPGTGNPKHIKENLGVYDFSLSPEEVKQVDELSSDPIAEDFIFFKL